MNLLYAGRYRNRFTDIIRLMGPDDKTVVELCFGDVFIADYCKETGRNWIGYDINGAFVDFARKKGHPAQCRDILSIESLPCADVLIFAGSLYHFSGSMDRIWRLMTAASPKILLSEPVHNITSQKNIIGAIGARATTVRNGAEAFRFDRDSFVQMLEAYRKSYGFTYHIISEKKDMLVSIHERDQYRHTGL